MKPSIVLFIPLFLISLTPVHSPASPQDQVYRADGRFEAASGIPRALYFQKKGPYQGTPEEKARKYLMEQAASFRLTPTLSDLSMSRVSESPMGVHVTFQQTVKGIPVYRSDIVVTIDRGDRVVFTTNSYKPNIAIPSTTPDFGTSDAIQRARTHLKVTGKLIGEQSATLMIYAEDPKRPRLAFRVVVPVEKPLGDWEVFVDALTGEVFDVADMAEYHHAGYTPPRGTLHARGSASPPPAGQGGLVNGSGLVYDPDPLTSDIVPYGTAGYVDNNDADTPELNGARIQVSLLDITLTGLIYELKGPHVQIKDFESPADTFTTPTHPDSFRFTRSQQAFEEVMVYYHIDQSQRYIQSLGFNNIQNLSMWADPHGLDGADNSHYIPSANRIAFGEGGIDDAEDADVIWHEYGHAIHNGTKPGWGASGGEARHLGEGFGDYWAGSYSSGWPAGADTVFNWDGRAPTGALRPLNNPAIYPRNGVATMEVHDAGEIWSSVLMLLLGELGPEVMDKLVLQSHYMIGANPTMRDNACAIIQSDKSLYGGAHVATLLDRFISRGFLRVDIEFVIDDTGSMYEEIGGVRDALTAFLSNFTEDTCLVFQLTTFKDYAYSRSLTINLADIRSQVAGLSAGGGGDCPEASVEALNAIRDTVRQGGVVLLVTDADPHPGTNLNAAISGLRARGIRVNVLLSGACTGVGMEPAAQGRIPSGNTLSASAVVPADPSIGPDGKRYRRTSSLSDTLVLGETDFIEVPLPFPFPFGGATFNSVFVNSEGYITFGEGSRDVYIGAYLLFSGPRRICGFWAGLSPPAGGTIVAAPSGPDFDIAFIGVPLYYWGNPVNFNIKLRPDGTFRITYGAMSIPGYAESLVGFSSGRNTNTPPAEIDLTTETQPIQAVGAGTAFEYFYPDTFDLANMSLEFAANTFNPP
ncbi:MAG TPA: M36 family metallopeptidase, partial [Bacteroidota bacterium]|nr:M36 family metallopeptidase [Bacteroidota bacterium]